SFSTRKLNLAAACLALSVAACLAFIVPVLGLVGAFAWASRGRGVARHLLLPALVFLFVLLAIPLNRVLLTDFAEGAANIRQTLNGLTGWPPVAVRIGLAILMLTAAAEIISRHRSDPALLLAGGTAWIALLILVVGHAWIG